MADDENTPVDEANEAEATEAGDDAGAEQKPAAKPMDKATIGKNLRNFGDVDVELDVILGDTVMTIEQLAKLSRGAIIELRQDKDSSVLLTANGKRVGVGDITVLGDNVAVTVTGALNRKPLLINHDEDDESPKGDSEAAEEDAA